MKIKGAIPLPILLIMALVVGAYLLGGLKSSFLKPTFPLATLIPSSPTPTPKATATPTPAKKLTYKLPAGWKTTQDKTGTIEVGYNPERVTPATFQVDDFWIFLMPKDGTAYSYAVGITSYNGGSRHSLIWNGGQPDIKYPTYQEKEYQLYNWSCLVIYGANISQGTPTNGMCAMGNNKALVFGNRDVSVSNNEEILRTIRLLK